MCGICGAYRWAGDPVDHERVADMRDSMWRRGPDGYGMSGRADYALGHRRLSIIDLSEAGRQPMTNEDGSVEVMFNGEIYNFQELLPELLAKGHRTRSRADTEVLIHGYEEWGLEGLLRRIRGMYALTIFDRRSGELHLARDPLGKKPIYYRVDAQGVAFASSIRALVRYLDEVPRARVEAVDQLLWNLCTPGPETILEGVLKLPAGTALTFGPDGRQRKHVHWRPDFGQPEYGVSLEEWIERVEDVLQRAVARRLIADVPVGMLLSGGVDSSLVTAFAAKAAGRVKTFSVATQDPALDESGFAEEVARQYGTDHHVLPVRPEMLDQFDGAIEAMGEPLADASLLNVIAISKLAREHVTVVLTGDGGDEAFGGYSHYLGYHMADRLRRLFPGALSGGLAAAGGVLKRLPSPLSRAGTLFRMAGLPLEESWGKSGWIDAATRAQLFLPATLERLGSDNPYRATLRELADAPEKRLADRVMHAQMRTILVDDYLVKVDQGSMAASLEARSPFLDVDLIELAARIPASVRFYKNEPKGLLREIARRHVPSSCVDRRKQGFVAPVGNWLRNEWRDRMRDLVLGPHVESRGWFERKSLERIVEEHEQGRNRAYLLWSLMVSEAWLRTLPTGSSRSESTAASAAHGG